LSGAAAQILVDARQLGDHRILALALVGLEVEQRHLAQRLRLDGGDVIEADTVVIAFGAIYRELPIKDLEQFTGGGVHYGASFLEAQLCK
jgi:thioredoxin reductase (NADPH)